MRLTVPALAGLAGLSAGFDTYVERGPVEPYGSTEEVVFLQGPVATPLPSPPVIQLKRATPLQTVEDVLMARLTSDDTFVLATLTDCWTAGYDEEYCCDVGDADCWGGIFTHERCCIKARAGRAYLEHDGQGARRAASPLLPRYGLNETRLTARRLRWRHGKHRAACAWEGVALPRLPPDLRGHPETGLRAAFSVLAAAGVATRRALHVGVSDGKSLDPLYPLIVTEGITGLGLEADSKLVQRAKRNLPSHFRVNQSFVTPGNIWPWAEPIGALDMVVVDIDSFECKLLEALLDGALRNGKPLPSLLHFETNTAIPPPFKFCRGFDPSFRGRPAHVADQQLASTSCSLSYAITTFSARGYDLLFFGYDSIFVRQDLRPHFEAAWGRRLPQDEFQCYRGSTVHATSMPLRSVREWFFRTNDPEDLHVTLGLLADNISTWSAFERLEGLPWVLFV